MSVIQSEFDSVVHEKLSNTSKKCVISFPVMLEQLAVIDIIALDAAVASGLPGERAARLLANRQVSFQKSGAAEPGRVIQVEEKVLFSGRNWLGRKSRCFEQMVAKRT